jgi:hypothetical protein
MFNFFQKKVQQKKSHQYVFRTGGPCFALDLQLFAEAKIISFCPTIFPAA